MIGGVLGMGRGFAESRMTDTCLVTRDGDRVWDEASGQHTVTPVQVYSGVCRVKHSTGAVQADAGSQLVSVSQLELHVPVGVAVLAAGDRVTVTGSVGRPDQVGRVFLVVAPFDGSGTTALRYRVEVADGR